MAWVPLAAFSQTYEKNQRHEADQEKVKNLKSGSKACVSEVGAKVGLVVAKDISIISTKKKLSTLYEDKKRYLHLRNCRHRVHK